MKNSFARLAAPLFVSGLIGCTETRFDVAPPLPPATRVECTSVAALPKLEVVDFPYQPDLIPGPYGPHFTNPAGVVAIGNELFVAINSLPHSRVLAIDLSDASHPACSVAMAFPEGYGDHWALASTSQSRPYVVFNFEYPSRPQLPTGFDSVDMTESFPCGSLFASGHGVLLNYISSYFSLVPSKEGWSEFRLAALERDPAGNVRWRFSVPGNWDVLGMADLAEGYCAVVREKYCPQEPRTVCLRVDDSENPQVLFDMPWRATAGPGLSEGVDSPVIAWLEAEGLNVWEAGTRILLPGPAELPDAVCVTKSESVLAVVLPNFGVGRASLSLKRDGRWLQTEFALPVSTNICYRVFSKIIGERLWMVWSDQKALYTGSVAIPH